MSATFSIDEAGMLHLPDGLSFGGSLSVENCTNLKSLPDGLKVARTLFLQGCTSLSSLPDGLSVGQSIHLDGCTSLTSLPVGLSVGHSLHIEGCYRIETLPADLEVGYCIYTAELNILKERIITKRAVPEIYIADLPGRFLDEVIDYQFLRDLKMDKRKISNAKSTSGGGCEIDLEPA